MSLQRVGAFAVCLFFEATELSEDLEHRQFAVLEAAKHVLSSQLFVVLETQWTSLSCVDKQTQTRTHTNKKHRPSAWRPAKVHAKVNGGLGVRTGLICSALAVGHQYKQREIQLQLVFVEAAELSDDFEHTTRQYLVLMPEWKRQKNDVSSQFFVLSEIPSEVQVLVLRRQTNTDTTPPSAWRPAKIL